MNTVQGRTTVSGAVTLGPWKSVPLLYCLSRTQQVQQQQAVSQATRPSARLTFPSTCTEIDIADGHAALQR